MPPSNKTVTMPTSYCKQKRAMVAPPPGSSDWSTVLELTLMHVKVGNILTISLTLHLKNVVNKIQK